MTQNASAAVRASVTFYGTRGTCPASGPHTLRYGGNTSCLELRAADGSVVVLDAGTGIRTLGSALTGLEGVGPATCAAGRRNSAQRDINLFLTHRHSDHVMGLPHFMPLHSRSHTVHVRCGDADSRGIANFIASLVSPPLFPYVEGLAGRLLIHDWPSHEGVRVGELLVRRFAANHPGGAAIVRVDDGNGPLLAYAPDNELALSDESESHQHWLKELREYLHKVPLLIHDSTYTAHELLEHKGWGHSSDEEALGLAEQCEAGTLALFHHHPDRSDDAIDEMLQRVQCLASRNASAQAPTILAASDDLTLSI